MYKKVDTSLNFVEREKEVIEFWKKNDIFKKSIKAREGHPTFMFYDGPPTANGKPHVGHIETRVMKDIIPRYKVMKGYNVIRKAGYGELFGHSTGHGVGIEIHESPNLAPKSKAILEVGNVVTVEPGIYIPDEFGVRIEDFVVITETGYRNLTSSPKNLIVL